MSTATFASESAVAVPTRLPTWVPRFVVRAAGALRQPARWPFSVGSPQGRQGVSLPVSHSGVAGAPVAPAGVMGVPGKGESDAVRGMPVVSVGGVASPVAVLPVDLQDPSVVDAVPVTTISIDDLGLRSQSIGTARQMASQGVTLRQMLVDVLLVAMWGALIPGLMWLGAMAGF